jgi:hypothetical protein
VVEGARLESEAGDFRRATPNLSGRIDPHLTQFSTQFTYSTTLAMLAVLLRATCLRHDMNIEVATERDLSDVCALPEAREPFDTMARGFAVAGPPITAGYLRASTQETAPV